MERFDLKKREQDSEDADEKNAHLKVWRTKRTEVNNNNNDDDGNAKLFHRSGFGDPYLEEKESLKEIHDRKRRSKGTPSDDKCYANEARNEDKNGVGKGSEKNLLEISRVGKDVRASTFEKTESNDLRGVDAFRMESKLTSDAGEKGAESKGGAREARKEEGKNAGKVVGGNYQQSGLSQGKSMGMEGKLTKEGKENLGEGNSLHSSESVTNELAVAGGVAAAAPSAAAAAASVSSSASSSPSSASLMSENPSSSQDKKDVARGAKEQEKSAAEQGKRSADESGNVNLHLESENKNLIQYSNENMKEGKRQAPFMLDMFNVKKTLLEKEDKPGKSISTIFNMKLAKAEVDTAAVKDCAKRGGNEKEVEIPITNGVLEFEKNKVKEVPYEDGTAGLALPSDIMERNVDEKRLKNSAREFDKRQSGQSAMNEEGIRNWFEAADRERVDANANQANIAVEKRNGNVDGGKGGKFKNEEECSNDNADNNNNNNNLVDGKNRGNVGKEKELNLIGSKSQESEVGGKEKSATNEVDGERKRKKKYQGGGFVAGNELNDQMTSDRYGQRKILQYMEYSNDEVEEADLNYNDREEEENQRQSVNAEKSDVSARRKERAVSDKKKAKVNVMIKSKMSKKKKEKTRKRRNPNVIEYYEYDNDMDQENDELSPSNEQERVKNNYQDKNPIEFDAGLGNDACTSPSSKT
ncbi:MATH and LRR domain-containing protein PFE0570w-like [Apis laboriosa]|uniref:MATH and LRR domain-containing protein PFE0570w-like n=1 Tax=Apis laboriosa TaxID=183418 RepID=UPI001CC4259A|nr:MATH and LRR domain-containing protein PFE0570w-like [Apis laboriosa]